MGLQGICGYRLRGIMEMTNHGIGNELEVTARALKAGIDMDMVSEYFTNHLQEAIEKKMVKMDDIDGACRRVLEAKYKLGLFDDSYKYCDVARAKATLGKAEHVRQPAKLHSNAKCC